MLEFITSVDHALLLFIQENFRVPWLTPVMEFISSLGNVGIFWIVMSLVFLCFKRTRKAGIAGLLSLLICLLITNEGLKNIVARMRPYHRFDDIIPLIGHPGDFSFPSGHSASAFAAAGAFARYLPKKAGVFYIVLAACIALSRLYLGVHYPTDVLAGILAGLLSALLGSFIVEKAYRRISCQHSR